MKGLASIPQLASGKYAIRFKNPDSCPGSYIAPFWTSASYWRVHAADVFDFINHCCHFEHSSVGEEKCFCSYMLIWVMKNVEKVKLFSSCTFQSNLEVFLKCSFNLVSIISPSAFHHTFFCLLNQLLAGSLG